MAESSGSGKQIGGIDQFRSLGGGNKRPAPQKNDTGQTTEQPPKKIEEPAPPSMPADAPAASAKEITPKRVRERMTIYLPPEQAEWIRVQAAIQRKEISEIVEQVIASRRERIE